YTYVNRLAQQLFGAPLDQILGRDDRDFFDMDKSHEIHVNDAEVMVEGHHVAREEMNFIKATGEKRIYWTVKKPLRDASGAIIGMCGISADITERKALEAKLEEQNRLLSAVLGNVDAYIYMKDRQRNYRYVNQKTADLFGLPSDQFIGRRDSEVLAPALADALWELDRAVFEKGVTQAAEETIPRDNGQVRHYWSVKVPFTLADGTDALIGFSTDITELHELKERFLRESITDALTGLASRRFFFEAAKKSLARARRDGVPVGFLIVDVDNFKQINDMHGHPVGDRVLVHVGALLKASMRDGDIVARLGGDEFAALFTNISAEQAKALAERLRAAIANDELTLPNTQSVRITSSLGLAFDAGNHASVDELYVAADKLLLSAKRLGRDRLQFDGA
ncbi:MAG: diguanylate cyclase, partial [Paucibacter sp.]|nr:diguanylate cyclase [Roseateles sp.]